MRTQSTCIFAKVGEFVFLISRPVTAANSLACRHSIGCSGSKRIEGARGSGQLTDLADGGGGGLLLAKREGHGGGRVGGGGAGESERKSELHFGVIIRQQGTIKVGGRYTTPRGAPAARQASETNARADDDVICGALPLGYFKFLRTYRSRCLRKLLYDLTMPHQINKCKSLQRLAVYPAPTPREIGSDQQASKQAYR